MPRIAISNLSPAFVCSADALEDEQRRHLQAGFCGYWLKPVNPERLKADLDAAAAPVSR